MPPNRLLTLCKQAVAYQIEFSRYHPRVTPNVPSLLDDYRCFTLPNEVHTTYTGHTDSVKCVTFVGENGDYIASGGSDNTIRIWRTESEKQDRNDTNITQTEAAAVLSGLYSVKPLSRYIVLFIYILYFLT